MGFHAMIVDNLKLPFMTVSWVSRSPWSTSAWRGQQHPGHGARGGIRQAVRGWIFRFQSAAAGAQWIDAIGTGWAQQHGEDPEVPSRPRRRPQTSRASSTTPRSAGADGSGTRPEPTQSSARSPTTGRNRESAIAPVTRGLYLKRSAGKGPTPSRRLEHSQPQQGRRRRMLQLRTAAVSSERRCPARKLDLAGDLQVFRTSCGVRAWPLADLTV